MIRLKKPHSSHSYDAPGIRGFRGHTERRGRLCHFAARIGSIFWVLKQPKNENASRNCGDYTGCARYSRTRPTRETESVGRWRRRRPGQSRTSGKQSRKSRGRARPNSEREGRPADQIRREPERDRFFADARERSEKKSKCFAS